ncbi:hypothetical protein XENOCAPTIV_028385, partial [Xenoophorus captivus]
MRSQRRRNSSSPRSGASVMHPLNTKLQAWVKIPLVRLVYSPFDQSSPEGLLTSIDLKDAYFHITIVPKHQYLRFVYQGISYQYNRPTLSALLLRVKPHSVVTALSLMRLLGMMSAAHVVVPLGLLHMRRLQRWFIRLRIDPVPQKRRMISVPPSVGPNLAHWGNPRILSEGVALSRPASHVS